ncbi:MAG: hypothetical protein SFY69_12380 [Planctomycetota bacterium]|nr:hypothetical protein [Planctomycetota bacterium]
MVGRTAGVIMLLFVAGAALVACVGARREARAARDAPGVHAGAVEVPTLSDTTPRDYAGLHNVVAYHEGYYSGSVPEGDAGFESLRAMGVRTIISVDGAEPEVERARAKGLRYIHLPIGYDGFEEDRKRELARATRDALREGPVYVHCHHGKHRSAGAAGAAAVSLGWATPEEMVARMRVSGTAPEYKGLYFCVSSADVIPEAEIDLIDPNFPEVSPPPSFVRGMVEIDTVFEHLKAIEKAGWRAPTNHPDLVPAAEAGRLADLFRVLAADPESTKHGAEFVAWMQADSRRAMRVEDMLAKVTASRAGGRPAPVGAEAGAAISAEFKFIAASCRDCHQRYRD